ncbi:MAG: cytochrome c3 family protein [Terriglobia bacterium]
MALTICGSPWTQGKAAVGTDIQPPPKPQPIPFSHKLHAELDLSCQYCHQLSKSGLDMTYPAEAKCMRCHATINTESPNIKKLASYYKEHKPVPWVQIYQVPDYVLFSHKRHVEDAKIACKACHGPVAERDVIKKEKPTSMASCIHCHSQSGARTTCNTCHNPNP